MPTPAPISSGFADLGPASTNDLNGLPNPGSAFDAETGKLFQFLRDGKNGEFARIEVVRFWPDPRCWNKDLKRLASGAVETTGWKGRAPAVVLRPLHDPGPKTLEESLRKQARWNTNFNRALIRIPEEVREAVCGFAPQHHWRVLNLLARAPGFLDRVEAQPLVVLAVAYANYFKLNSVCRPYRSARALQTKRSVDILRWLDWPAPKSSLKLLARLDPSAVALSDLYRLRELVERGERWLRHLPQLNPSTLLMLDYHRNFVCFRLVEQLAKSAEQREQRWMVRAVRRLRRWVARGPEGRRVARVRDSHHLQQLTLALARRRRRAEQGHLPSERRRPPVIDVPPPPFESHVDTATGPLVLRALTSGQQLFEHSRRMGNCLAFAPPYLKAIEAGQGAAYELNWSGEGKQLKLTATAYFERAEEGHWALKELALPYNADAPDWLKHKVWKWLSVRAPIPPPSSVPPHATSALPELNEPWLPF